MELKAKGENSDLLNITAGTAHYYESWLIPERVHPFGALLLLPTITGETVDNVHESIFHAI